VVELDAVGQIKALKTSGFGSYRVSGELSGTNAASDAEPALPFCLTLMTADCAHNFDLMRLLGRWRYENESWFQSTFPITESGTARWFEQQVTAQPDRLLFLVEVNGKYVGHVGLFRFRFAEHCCEVDNIVRGESGFPGIMAAACSLLMEWGRDALGLRSYELQTYSDNARALALYMRLGFVETERVAMKHVPCSGGGAWVPLEQDEISKPVLRSTIHMELRSRGE
jgi:RimJ/RimL family protein N-acetyltransferase